MIENLVATAIGAIVAFLATGAVAAVVVAVKRRVKIQSPEAAIVEKLAPTVNALLDMQGPQTEALIAILEALQGNINWNVKTALENTRTAKKDFDDFIRSSARVSLERAN